MAEFIQEKYSDDWLVHTNNGFEEFRGVGQTIKYNVWEIYTTNYQLECADIHILIKLISIDNDSPIFAETYVKDLMPGDSILVVGDDGNNFVDVVMVVHETERQEHMYDLLDVENSLYVTNNVVSRNSTTTICYALWLVLFKNHQNLAILANKRDLAMELLGRLQMAYENLPLWLQQGVLEWNKSHIELENGSQIIASSTSATSVRGSTYNCIGGDSLVNIKKSSLILNITIEILYSILLESSDFKSTDDGDVFCKDVDFCKFDSIINESYTKNGATYITDCDRDFRILNELGYCGFAGVRRTKEVQTIMIYFDDGEHLICTPDHKLMSEHGWIEARNSFGVCIVSNTPSPIKVTMICEYEKMYTYDILEVEYTHSFFANGVLVSNCVFCDEFAFVPNSIQEEFMTSVYPTISSSKDSKLIITSCVTKDTFILTNKGYTKLETLIKDELEKKSYYVPEYETAGMYQNNKGNVICNNGETKIRKIYTNINQTNCSEVHKFYACKNGKYGWFMASELDVGDSIALKYNTQIYGNEDNLDSELFPVVTPALAYFFGVYCGAGYITDDRFITLSIRRTNSGIFDEDRYDDAIKNINIDYEFDGVSYVINSPELVKILKILKYNNPDKYANYGNGMSELPMKWSKPNIIALLQGIFDSMALYNYNRIKSVTGDIYINSQNEDLVEQIHVLLLNVGILNTLRTGVWEQNRYYWHIKRKMRYSPRSFLKVKNCDAPEFFDIIGFVHSHKKTWKDYQICTRKFRKNYDVIPHFITFLRKYLTDAQLLKFVKNRMILSEKGRNTCFNMSRRSALQRIDVLRNLNISDINKFIDINVRPDITWAKIYKIIDDRTDYVYDLSLNHVENDPWCHSVLYNGNVGHQTPRGYNLYYKIYTQAVNGTNEYVPVEITWDMIPGRDEEFKRITIANTSARQFEQEFESSDASTIVRIQDLEGNDKDITLGELYELLREQNELLGEQNEMQQDIIDISSESIDC